MSTLTHNFRTRFHGLAMRAAVRAIGRCHAIAPGMFTTFCVLLSHHLSFLGSLSSKLIGSWLPLRGSQVYAARVPNTKCRINEITANTSSR